MGTKKYCEEIGSCMIKFPALVETWNKGATAMLERLLELGYVDPLYETIVRKDVKDIMVD